jgi:hypothetical protein
VVCDGYRARGPLRSTAIEPEPAAPQPGAVTNLGQSVRGCRRPWFAFVEGYCKQSLPSANPSNRCFVPEPGTTVMSWPALSAGGKISSCSLFVQSETIHQGMTSINTGSETNANASAVTFVIETSMDDLLPLKAG